MRTSAIIAGAGVLFATATLGFAQSQELAPPAGRRWKHPNVSEVPYRPRAKQPAPPPSVSSCRNQKASYVPRPELTLA
jgi:hypothetical protein